MFQLWDTVKKRVYCFLDSTWNNTNREVAIDPTLTRLKWQDFKFLMFIFTSTTLCFHPTVKFSHRRVGAGKCSNFHHFLCIIIYLQPATDFFFLTLVKYAPNCWFVPYKKGKHVEKRHILTVQSVTTPWKRKVWFEMRGSQSSLLWQTRLVFSVKRDAASHRPFHLHGGCW